MMKDNKALFLLFIIITLSPFIIIYIFDIKGYSNQRLELTIQRRYISPQNSTRVAAKVRFIKNAITNLTGNAPLPQAIRKLTPSEVALEMNRLERIYHLPYSWGGSIKNYQKGFDCSGFLHGIFYFLGKERYKKRFTTRSLFWLLKKDPSYKLIWDAKRDGIEIPDDKMLKIGDIIIWPSGIRDGRNIPGPIWGHLGIVTTRINGVLQVTHYVRSDAYDPYDNIGIKGSGLNTMPAHLFMRLKKRGRLTIFRHIGEGSSS